MRIKDFGFIVVVFCVLTAFTPSIRADGFVAKPSSPTSFTFTVIDYPGSFSVPGQNSTVTTGINDLGEIIGTYEDGTGGTHGFTYVGGSFSTLDLPGGETTLSGINDSGEIVGDSLLGGFLDNNGLLTLTTGPGGILLDPRGINNLGQIVGDFVNSTGEHGFLQSGSTFTAINFPGAITTSALGINDMGEIVGSYTNASGEFGFLYSGGHYQTIDCPGAADGNALGISDSGAIVGDCILNGHDNGFLYSGGKYTLVDVPGHLTNEAIGINDRGRIVGFTGAAVPEPPFFELLAIDLSGLAVLCLFFRFANRSKA